MNKQLQQVVEAWPILSAVTLIMVILLSAFAKTFIGDVIETDISKTDKIIAMDASIQSNQVLAKAVKEDTEDIIDDIDKLDAKLDRLIEIMLTDE